MMTQVTLPLWLVVLAALLAMIAALDRILVPSLRWFLRRRMERLVARLNLHLERPIEPFRLMARGDRINRLLYDPQVMAAMSAYAAENAIPEAVAFEEVRGYAREIVPSFSALLYFGFATKAARWFSRLLYRVRVGRVDAALAQIDRDATVIFVMNHRSNLDYVLVTWLVAHRSTLSYAVGEWARIWPLSALIRSMGAYFIRRGSGNPLYRRVLARYVQLASAEGITQAMFPEGGLSLDGRVGPPRMGLLRYIWDGFDAQSRDVVFVPVGLGYDRVLEDRVLMAVAKGRGKSVREGAWQISRGTAWAIWQRIRGAKQGFGTAAVGFGVPLSLRSYSGTQGATVEGLAEELMARVLLAVPVVAVPLVAAAVQAGAAPRAEILARVQQMALDLHEGGAVLKVPPGELIEVLEAVLQNLEARGLVTQGPFGIEPAADQADLLAYYAGAVEQRLEELNSHY